MAFVDEVRAVCPANVRRIDLDAHINDPAFNEAALEVADGWMTQGVLARP